MKFAMSMTAIFAMLTQFAPAAVAQDFLRGLDVRTEAAAATYNSRSITEHLYFAKRHRIVEIDTPMLQESRIDGVTLFDGEEKIDLVLERIHKGQIDGAATWLGRIELPPELKSELEGIQSRDAVPEQIISQIGRLELQILYWDLNLTTGEAYLSAERQNRKLSPTPVAVAKVGEVKEYAFASVTGQIDLSILGRGIYRLEPLENSPRYHILYEVDPSRTFGVVEDGSRAKAEVTGEGRKKLNYNEFLKSLPPRTAVPTKGDL